MKGGGVSCETKVKRAEQKAASRLAAVNAKEAAAAEIRRQRAVGEALDLQAQLDEVRGGKLVVPEAIAQGDLTRLTMAMWARGVTVLDDLSRNAPSLRVRLRAADALTVRAHEMAELLTGANGDKNVVQAQPMAAAPEAVLTKEQACEVLQLRRKLAARGA